MSEATVVESPSGEAFIGDLLADLKEGRADLVERGSFSVAIVDGAGTSQWAEAAFSDLIADTGAPTDCRRLARAALREGRAAGLVATPRGAVVVEARGRSRVGAWPLPAPAQAALREAGDRIVMIAFAPSRAPKLALRAADAVGLTPREADLAAALLEAPSLEIASVLAGMRPGTAKDVLDRACRRIGVRGASDLVGRLLEVACGAGEADESIVAETLGLTAAEGRVAAGMAEAWSVTKTADALGLTEATVKSYRKAIFAKTGAARDRDFRRLFMETARLTALRGAAEVVLEDRAAGERLRMVARPDGRRVALIDYGPFSGRPLIVMHGFTTGRRLPSPFVARLHRDGWRPLVVQRPGFGLTDPAGNDYLAQGADDMAAVLVSLGARAAAVLARDGAVATAIAFAERHPAAFLRGAVINPRSTRERPPRSGGALGSLSRLLLNQPALIAVIAEGFRRRSASAQTRALMQRLYAGPDGDRFAAERPDILDHVIRDSQAMMARTMRGPMDELRLYAEGWRLPRALAGRPWRASWGTEVWTAAEAEAWRAAGAEISTTEGLGLLGAYTHPDALANLLLD